MNKSSIITLVITLSISNLLFAQSQQRIKWPSLADSPWPVLRGDMQGTGRSDYVGPSSLNPYINWVLDMPLGIDLGPSIGFDDILFFGSFEFDGGLQNHLYSYYPNGSSYWIYNTGTGMPNRMSALITSDSTVFMASNSGELFALTHSGNLKWTVDIGFGSKTQISLDREGNIYTYNQDTLKVINPQGDLIFCKYFEGISTPIIFSPDGRTIYFKIGYFQAFDDQYLIAADLDGNIMWRYRFFESNAAPVSIDNEGNIYLYGTDSLTHMDYVYAINDDGEIKWKYPTEGYLDYNAAAIDKQGNIIFYCRKGPETANYMVSLNYAGEVNWEVPLEPDKDPTYAQIYHGPVCDAKGNIYFGSGWGNKFYAMDKNGNFLWDTSLNGNEYSSSPAIGSDGTLYIGSQGSENSLIAINDEPRRLSENRIEEGVKNI